MNGVEKRALIRGRFDFSPHIRLTSLRGQGQGKRGSSDRRFNRRRDPSTRPGDQTESQAECGRPRFDFAGANDPRAIGKAGCMKPIPDAIEVREEILDLLRRVAEPTKAKMIGPRQESLGQAVHAFKPDANSKNEAKKGTKQAAMTAVLALLLTGLCLAQSVTPPAETEINTVLMNSTFRIVGQGPGGQQSLGTAFIVGRPIPDQKDRARYVLVTAAHVLSQLVGDTAILFTRQKDSQGRWNEAPFAIPIRANGQPTWVKNPNADVAAMYVALPFNAVPNLITAELLADDALVTRFEVHPGDELNVLGYPLGIAGPGGFPVLRSGKIASYPLVPSKDNPYFLLDFRIFEGNSGGPVYLVSYNRFYAGLTNIGSVRMIMGLVSEEVGVTQEFRGLYENRSQRFPLELAKIVPASFIRDTINMLPEPSEAATKAKPTAQ